MIGWPPPLRPKTLRRPPPIEPRNACRPEGRRRVPAVWLRTESHGQARGELGLAKNGRPEALCSSFRSAPAPFGPSCPQLVVGFARPLFKVSQRGALSHPRSGSASDRRLQPTDSFFKDDCSCLAALRTPDKPHGIRRFPCPTLGNQLRRVEFPAERGFRPLVPSLNRTSDSPSPSPRPEFLAKPLQLDLEPVPRSGLGWFPHGFA